VWIGIGAVGTVIAGIALFKEPIDVPKALCLVAIIAGVAGLKYLSGEGA
jgi:quaternary ammonium compound-resistance protein SugE